MISKLLSFFIIAISFFQLSSAKADPLKESSVYQNHLHSSDKLVEYWNILDQARSSQNEAGSQLVTIMKMDFIAAELLDDGLTIEELDQIRTNHKKYFENIKENLSLKVTTAELAELL